MKVQKVTSVLGRFGITVEPEDYDGTPRVGTLWFERQPRELHHDRFLLGAYLAFGHLAAGRLTTGKLHSPALVEAIRRDAEPVWLQVPDVELYAKKIPRGSKDVLVDVDTLTGTLLADSEPTGRLSFPRADHHVGAVWGGRDVAVPTNAWLLGVAASPERVLRIALACAVIYAEECDVDTIVVPATDGVTAPHSLQSLENLLSAVGLGLDVADSKES